MATLREFIIQLQIKGGGIKTSTKTRWSTIYDCCESIYRLHSVFDKILNEKPNILNGNSTLADCFFHICCLGSSLYHIPATTNDMYQNFHDYSFKKFNDRWKELDHKTFVLAYFLHPVYRGKKNCHYACELIQQMGFGPDAITVIVSQFR
ncbi:3125_t:CDS:2, partial [Diversispora eburnea]